MLKNNAILLSLLISTGLFSCSNQSSLAPRVNEATAVVPLQVICESDDPKYQNSLKTVWETLPAGYQFAFATENARISKHLQIYESRQKFFNGIGDRAEKYLYYVHAEVKKRGMPTELALLPVVESGFDPFAYSHGRAAGMWQFIPGTAKIFDLETNWWYEGRRDIEASTDAALDYLQILHKRFDGDWLLALAAYNAGSGNVFKAIEKNKKLGKPYDYWSLDLPEETIDYVPKLIALAQVIDNPAKYNVTLKYIPNAPYFDTVNPDGQIDLSQVAQLSQVSLNEIYLLNPGYNRWATEPEKSRNLLVPYTQTYVFQENIQSLSKADRLAWQRYQIKSGDTLSSIASSHHINIDFLKSINKLSSNTIRLGDTLMIPSPLENNARYQLSQSQRQQALAQQTQEGKKRISYEVKEKDSFWSIAQTFNVGVRELARWNGMAPGDTLKINQSLNIWLDSSASVEREIFRKINYTVRQGDSLSRIASRFNVSIADIQHWNKLQASKLIYPGQQLVLQVNVAK